MSWYMKKESQENIPSGLVDRVSKWAKEEEEYPLHVRAAAKLYLEGISEEQFILAFRDNGLGHPFAHSVLNALREFHIGVNKMNPQLQKFAEQMI